MSKRTAPSPLSMPLMAFELAISSWEVIARRTFMMATDTCSPLEYQRMLTEKLTAVQHSSVAFLSSGGTADPAALLAPWHRRAVANAKRLRRGR